MVEGCAREEAGNEGSQREHNRGIKYDSDRAAWKELRVKYRLSNPKHSLS